MSFLPPTEPHLSGHGGSTGPLDAAFSQLKPSSPSAQGGPQRIHPDPQIRDSGGTQNAALSSILRVPSNAECQPLLLLQRSSPPSRPPSPPPPGPRPFPLPWMRQRSPHSLTHPRPAPSAHSHHCIRPLLQWASATLKIKSTNPLFASQRLAGLLLPTSPACDYHPDSAHLLYRLPFHSFWASGSLSSWIGERLFSLLSTLIPIPLSLDNPPHRQCHIITGMLITVTARAANV